MAEIKTKNVEDNELNPRMKYIMVRLEKLWRNSYKRGDRIHDSL